MIFKKKYPRIEDQEFETEEPQPVSQDPTPEVKSTALSADIIKLKAQFDQFSELRKVINERFTRLNEQVGELRGMIMDTNRSMQDMEVKTVKAVDLVDAPPHLHRIADVVQPPLAGDGQFPAVSPSWICTTICSLGPRVKSRKVAIPL